MDWNGGCIRHREESGLRVRNEDCVLMKITYQSLHEVNLWALEESIIEMVLYTQRLSMRYTYHLVELSEKFVYPKCRNILSFNFLFLPDGHCINMKT